MSSESMSSDSSYSGSSSGCSSSESLTSLPGRVETVVLDLLSERSGSLAAGVATGGGGLSPDQAAEGTEMDVEILEEGEEAKTPGPTPSGVLGQPKLLFAIYQLGRSRVTEETLDEYVDVGCSRLHFVICVTFLGERRCLVQRRTKPLGFVISLRLGCDFPTRIL